MSYGMAAALQEAVFQRLTGDAAVTALAGSAIYDVVPSGSLPALYVTLGQEEVRDASDKTGGGARHDFTVSVVSDGSGFLAAKTIAAAVSDALVDADLSLSRGRLVALDFLRARASREGTGQLRRIELRFRARIEDD
ncbi:DUF3168 domain-containing protein [Lutimaribacter saemankumensis]|uniref:Gene transfer agent protein n=1 Tax=Lutimaribacter saemankumensis TaxID=490829 RepID=A0A1G8HLP4_9RHOB|nr:DUF3168 domain-containing protein [Lutimaribacter saemankumensis]SDI07606.1 Protein of unknown function [Lutimaribacter saemankumensis]